MKKIEKKLQAYRHKFQEFEKNHKKYGITRKALDKQMGTISLERKKQGAT